MKQLRVQNAALEGLCRRLRKGAVDDKARAEEAEERLATGFQVTGVSEATV